MIRALDTHLPTEGTETAVSGFARFAVEFSCFGIRAMLAILMAVSAGPVLAGPAGASADVSSFQLISGVTGTQPFTVGLEFKQGDIPNTPVLSVPDSQAIVESRWNDGSVKMAIASGEVKLTAGVPATVGVANGGPATGVNLTAASISAAHPSATASLGAYGSVSLANLLGKPFTTWISGPEMVEAHYRSGVGGDPTLQVWFHVRLYKSGRMWVQAVVENGDVDVTTADKTLTKPSVVIGNATVYSAPSLTQYAHTSWTAEGWIGGDPQITPVFNTAYLESTGLVPNYLNRPPDSSALDSLYQSYAPYQNGGWSTSMGMGGYQDQIGILPRWDALYITSGGDARAYRSVLANARALGSYSIIWNDSQTSLPTMPSKRPNWTAYGNNQGGGTQYSAGPLIWDIAHHGSGGYLAYLLTGNYYYLEIMEQQAATVYLMSTSGSLYDPGSLPGTGRIIRGQTRGAAWSNRTIGQLAAIGPSSDPIVTDYRKLLATQAAHWTQVMHAPGVNPLGYLYVYNSYSTTAEVEAPWMQNFWVQTYGYISDLQPFPNMSVWNGVRDHLFQTVVGTLGPGGSDGYCFTRASTYGIQIGAAVNPDPTTWYTSWGMVDRATVAYNKGSDTSCGNTLQGASGGTPQNAATGYWGNLLPAIAYAVQDGATGAAAAWARLTGATNWPAILASGFNNLPQWGIVPRTYPTPAPSTAAHPPPPLGTTAKPTAPPATPSATPLASASGTLATIAAGMRPGVWVQIANTQVKPLLARTESQNNAYTNGIDGPSAVFDAWTGSAYDAKGMRWFFHGGGHADYGGNEVYQFDFNTLSWEQLTKPYQLVSTAAHPCPVPATGPAAAHSYDGIVYSPRSNTVWYLDVGTYCSSAGEALMPPAPKPPVVPNGYLWEFDPRTDTWAKRATIPGAIGGVPFGGSTLDADGNPQFVTPTAVYQVDALAKTATRISGGDNISFPSVTSCGGLVWVNDWGTFRKWSLDYTQRAIVARDGTANPRGPRVTYNSGILCDAKHDRLVFWSGTSALTFYNISSGTWTTYTPTGAGPTVAHSAGVESKWKYIAQYDVYAGYNNVNEGVWLIKLPAP